MINSADMSAQLALDVQGMNQLKLESKQPTPEALKKAAQQFEALFMNMMLKSMREATPQDGMFDSEQTRLYTSMLDQQLSQTMASRGIGLAEVMVRQLSTTLGPALGMEQAVSGQASEKEESLPMTDMPVLEGKTVADSAPAANSASGSDRRVQDFTQRLMPHAQQASQATGIPPHFMLGQAALETGWGRHEIRGENGEQSYNLFNIKAGSNWKGKTVDVLTTEYVNGLPEKRVETFRAYDSYTEAFSDYANLMRANPRYRSVIAQGNDAAGFALGLQRAGYATDPNYARKLMGVIQRVVSA